MVVLSKRDIEGLSRRILRQYLSLVDAPLTAIDPRDFAEKICNLKFVFADLSQTGALLGITSFSDITVTVPVGKGMGREFHLCGNVAFIDRHLNQERNHGRLNFTMMHEAAHQVLGIVYPTHYNAATQPIICRYADIQRPIQNWGEWQTNVLASYLLLPRELVQKAMQQVDLGCKVKRLNKVFAPKDYDKFCQMAEILGVSKTALAIRMQDMGLIEQNDFADPYSLVRIYVEDHELEE